MNGRETGQKSYTLTQAKKYVFVNTLTMLRAGVALGSTVALTQGDTLTAAVGIVAALATEMDGTLARRWKVTSPEGAARDTLADLSWFNSILFFVIYQFVSKYEAFDAVFGLSLGLFVILYNIMLYDIFKPQFPPHRE